MKKIICLSLFLLSAPAPAFDLKDVAQRAQALAQKPYETGGRELPQELQELSYDQYRDIRFKPERSLWRSSKLPFEVQFFHPGFYFKQAVKIHLINSAGAQSPGPARAQAEVQDFPFDPGLFDYGKNELSSEALADVPGYAGFRVHYPLNNKSYKDEVIVFQGASYFRALGRGQRYGLSARGLAVDTGLASGEEFPAFTEVWILRPQPQDRQLVIYALLDSRRVTGAYRFVLKPGDNTNIDVQARIYLRENVGKLGVAPLTSMFDFGENSPHWREDYRPEVHDSDGLSVQLDREWVWRPLVNPRRLFVTSFGLVNPRGFGLMQRDRNFGHYEDLEARYDLRPSVWIAPRGNWGEGRVELVQIPTPDETNDNVVAYWVPDSLPEPGQPLALNYTLSWQMNNETRPPLAYVTQTRRGHGYIKEDDGSIRFNIDFAGGELAKLKPDVQLMAGVWVGDNGELLERQAYRNPVSGGWRVSLRMKREDDDKAVEMRCVLRNKNKSVSETWAYVLPPHKADTQPP